MKYKIEISDYKNDKLIVKIVEASNVFDAIDKVEKELDRPEDMYLNSAMPIFE